jgi:hypothetical protein
MYLDGGADEDDGVILKFNITAADVTEFPELKGALFVELYETDQGFVVGDVTFSEEVEA